MRLRYVNWRFKKRQQMSTRVLTEFVHTLLYIVHANIECMQFLVQLTPPFVPCKCQDKASSFITEAESNAEENFVTQKEKNEIFQKAYKEVIECKSTKLHGNGYLAKNPTRKQLLNADRQEQICREEQQHEEHVELMELFGQLQQ